MLKNLCRICTKETNIDDAINLFEQHTQKLLLQIETLTGLSLTHASNMPDCICTCCQNEVRQASAFRQKIIDAQEFLMKETLVVNKDCYVDVGNLEYHLETESICIKNECFGTNDDTEEDLPLSTVQVMLRCEPNIDSELTNNDDDFNHLDDGYVASENEEDVLKTAKTKCSKQNSSTSNNKNKNIEKKRKTRKNAIKKVNAGIKEETMHDDDHYTEDSEEKPMSTEPELALSAEPENSVKKGETTKKRKLKTTDTLSADDKSNISAKSQKFICDQCGNSVVGRNAFDQHLRRHFGVKEYQCELCTDRFCTHSELKRHMRRHTGERPFACRHCGRRFTDYSTRVKHERTHTNERPYLCTHCGKAFTTSYILKNHMLIHTGERSFRCEPCNKSFQRQTHLATHCRSIAHKQSEEKVAQLKGLQKVTELPP